MKGCRKRREKKHWRKKWKVAEVILLFSRSQTKAHAGQKPQRTSNHFWSLSTKKCFVVNAAKAVCVRAAFAGRLCDSFYPRSVCFLPLIIFLSAFKHWQRANTTLKHKCERARTVICHRRCQSTSALQTKRTHVNQRNTCTPSCQKIGSFDGRPSLAVGDQKREIRKNPWSAFQSQDAAVVCLIGAQFWSSINSKLILNTLREDRLI